MVKLIAEILRISIKPCRLHVSGTRHEMREMSLAKPLESSWPICGWSSSTTRPGEPDLPQKHFYFVFRKNFGARIYHKPSFAIFANGNINTKYNFHIKILKLLRFFSLRILLTYFSFKLFSTSYILVFHYCLLREYLIFNFIFCI